MFQNEDLKEKAIKRSRESPPGSGLYYHKADVPIKSECKTSPGNLTGQPPGLFFFPINFLNFTVLGLCNVRFRNMQCPVPEYAMSGFCVTQRIHPFTTHVQLSFYDIYEASSVYSTYARFESSSILTSEFIHINPAPDCPVFVHSHN